MNARTLAAGWAGLALLASACGPSSRDAEPATTLRVFAASSLTEAFTSLANAFEARHDGVEVELTFAGSTALVAQLGQGAGADVLATADADSMRAAVDAGDVDEPVVVFARNRLTLLVEEGNPLAIGTLRDAFRDGRTVAVCAPELPCGRAAERFLRRAQIRDQPASEEENVKGVVAKVLLGEVDAGLVYVTDALAAADDADAVELPRSDDDELTTDAVVGVTSAADEADLGQAWIELLRSHSGRRTLVDHGFLEA